MAGIFPLSNLRATFRGQHNHSQAIILPNHLIGKDAFEGTMVREKEFWAKAGKFKKVDSTPASADAEKFSVEGCELWQVILTCVWVLGSYNRAT